MRVVEVARLKIGKRVDLRVSKNGEPGVLLLDQLARPKTGGNPRIVRRKGEGKQRFTVDQETFTEEVKRFLTSLEGGLGATAQ